ncbi:glycosyl transferase [Cnuibacter physcomitrellae]|uniref:Uncharacterized protein n=1 Tax=Cnuibacter physcomitrellae TaxID=1619308 RepID=A0A1X9LNI3_9MICO|nr:glycosyltransferase family 2 protein [Cnuibacter physcomitrellae]ARJ06002.1 hypothetical protein B5808_12790 [Cnuibacter physcomitrellae]GGI36988.1 glycosyl transferase [Cnuibacter physcomitrellae]
MSATDRTDPWRVAVVTVSYDSVKELESFLGSIDAASRPADETAEGPAVRVETHVADNHPESGQAGAVRDVAARHAASYTAIAGNPGYGSAVNAVVRTLDPGVDAVLISNPDVVLGPASIVRLTAALASDDSIGAAGPRILEADGTVYPSARAIPSVVNGAGHALFSRIWPGNPWTAAYRQHESVPTERDAGWLSGACLLVRRSVFDELGGFDQAYFMYFEDVDLGFRLGRLGYRNVYAPRAVVTHTGAHSTAESSEMMLRAHHDSAKTFLTRRYPGRLLWPLRAVLGLGLDIRRVSATRRSRRGDG